MKRIAISGISIECLERSPVRARYEDFDIHRGEQLFDNGLSFIPGMIDRLKAEADLQICPLPWARRRRAPTLMGVHGNSLAQGRVTSPGQLI
jgi:hypothetical protein